MSILTQCTVEAQKQTALIPIDALTNYITSIILQTVMTRSHICFMTSIDHNHRSNQTTIHSFCITERTDASPGIYPLILLSLVSHQQASPLFLLSHKCPVRQTHRSLFIIIILWSCLLNPLLFKANMHASL